MTGKNSFDGDLPRTHPSSDLFGYLSFAQRLAAAIIDINSPGGVVLAVTGGWGSGKSTLLNFVKRELSNAQVAPYPAIIDFNPWWFSSRDDLAPQMIRALRDRVHGDKFTGVDVSSTLTKYAESISSTAGHFGGSLLKVGTQAALKAIGRTSPDFADLKKSIAKQLGGTNQKYVFFVDDIDRLAPSEVVELLRSVKAVGDFPNVIYVLAFDRNVVAESIGAALSTDGDAYLEKIVQAIFPIPAVDRLTLRKWLFEQLDKVLSDSPGAKFDQSYWSEVYFDGLDALFKKPRDVVRFINSLSITYPAVAGEVNVVDFIAIEALRLFSPRSYAVIREHPERFSGEAKRRGDSDSDDKAFSDRWMVGLKDEKSVANVLSRVFPRFGSGRDGHYFESGSRNWRHAMRVCDPDMFPTYFQFSTPAKIAGRALVGQIKWAASQSDAAVRAVLLSSTETRDAAGVSQIRDLIDRLADSEEEISRSEIPNLLAGLLQVGDEIITSEEGRTSGFLEVSIHYRLISLVSRLVADIPVHDRIAQVKLAFADGRAVSLMVWVIGSIQRVLTGREPTSKEIDAFESFDGVELVFLQDIVAAKFRALGSDELLRLPALNIVVTQLLIWHEANAVRSRLLPLLRSKQSLPSILERLASFSTSHSSADPVVRRKARLDPRMFDRFVDSRWIDSIVGSGAQFDDLSDVQREVIRSYLWARDALAEGKTLDGFWDPDDE